MSRLIDADELINNIDCSADLGGALGKVVECVKYYAKFMAASAPTIEERKTGKWIIRDNPLIGWFRVSCSECGEDVTSNIPTIGFFPHCEPLWDYCPYCGADMRGEE